MSKFSAARFAKEHIYIDYDFEEVMFHWDPITQKVHRKFYGDNLEEVIEHSNRFFHEAIVRGEEINKQQYAEGKLRKTYPFHGDFKPHIEMFNHKLTYIIAVNETSKDLLVSNGNRAVIFDSCSLKLGGTDEEASKTVNCFALEHQWQEFITSSKKL